MSANQEDGMISMVWQSQPLAAPRVSLEFVQHQAEKLNADFRYECYVMYAVTMLSAVVLLMNFLQLPFQSDLSSSSSVLVGRLGSALMLLGSIYITLQVRRRGKILLAGQDEKVVHSLGAYRIELQRRRDYCFGAWSWSIWPMMPAVAVYWLGGLLYDARPDKLVRYGLMLAVWFVVALLGSWHYYRKGKKFQRELDAVATLDGN
ncbi:MAG: hypothetical protein QM808_06480 [Steroidobacteraceae bacterium]